jgi:hypothetical protein
MSPFTSQAKLFANLVMPPIAPPVTAIPSNPKLSATHPTTSDKSVNTSITVPMSPRSSSDCHVPVHVSVTKLLLSIIYL